MTSRDLYWDFVQSVPTRRGGGASTAAATSTTAASSEGGDAVPYSARLRVGELSRATRMLLAHTPPPREMTPPPLPQAPLSSSSTQMGATKTRYTAGTTTTTSGATIASTDVPAPVRSGAPAVEVPARHASPSSPPRSPSPYSTFDGPSTSSLPAARMFSARVTEAVGRLLRDMSVSTSPSSPSSEREEDTAAASRSQGKPTSHSNKKHNTSINDRTTTLTTTATATTAADRSVRHDQSTFVANFSAIPLSSSPPAAALSSPAVALAAAATSGGGGRAGVGRGHARSSSPISLSSPTADSDGVGDGSGGVGYMSRLSELERTNELLRRQLEHVLQAVANTKEDLVHSRSLKNTVNNSVNNSSTINTTVPESDPRPRPSSPSRMQSSSQAVLRSTIGLVSAARGSAASGRVSGPGDDFKLSSPTRVKNTDESAGCSHVKSVRDQENFLSVVKENDALQVEVLTLRRSLLDLQSTESDRQLLKDTLTALQAEHTAFSRNHQYCSAEKERLSSLEAEVEKLRAERTLFTARLDESSAEANAHYMDSNESKRNVERLSEALKSVVEENNSKTQQVETLQSQNEKLLAEVMDLRSTSFKLAREGRISAHLLDVYKEEFLRFTEQLLGVSDAPLSSVDLLHRCLFSVSEGAGTGPTGTVDGSVSLHDVSPSKRNHTSTSTGVLDSTTVHASAAQRSQQHALRHLLPLDLKNLFFYSTSDGEGDTSSSSSPVPMHGGGRGLIAASKREEDTLADPEEVMLCSVTRRLLSRSRLGATRGIMEERLRAHRAGQGAIAAAFHAAEVAMQRRCVALEERIGLLSHRLSAVQATVHYDVSRGIVQPVLRSNQTLRRLNDRLTLQVDEHTQQMDFVARVADARGALRDAILAGADGVRRAIMESTLLRPEFLAAMERTVAKIEAHVAHAVRAFEEGSCGSRGAASANVPDPHHLRSNTSPSPSPSSTTTRITTHATTHTHVTSGGGGGGASSSGLVDDHDNSNIPFFSSDGSKHHNVDQSISNNNAKCFTAARTASMSPPHGGGDGGGASAQLSSSSSYLLSREATTADLTQTVRNMTTLLRTSYDQQEAVIARFNAILKEWEIGMLQGIENVIKKESAAQ